MANSVLVDVVREGLGLTSAELAKALRCSRATVYRWQIKDPPAGLAREVLEHLARHAKSRKRLSKWGRALGAADDFRAWLTLLSAPTDEPMRVRNVRKAKKRARSAK